MDFSMTPQAKRKNQILRIVKGMAESKREHLNVTNQAMNHDAGSGLAVGAFGRPNDKTGWNWLATTKSSSDPKYARDGDSIFSQYVDYKLQLMGSYAYPSQACRVIIFTSKTYDNSLISSSDVSSLFVSDGSMTGSGNLLIQPVDTFKFKVLRDFIVYPLKNQTQGSAPNSNGLLYDIMHPPIPSGPFTSESGFYRSLYTDFQSIWTQILAAAPTCPEAAAIVAQYHWSHILQHHLQYEDAVDRYDDIQEEITMESVDPAGNDAKYPIVSGRIKVNRKIQYQVSPKETQPIKDSDHIQCAIIPYADYSAGTGDTILHYNLELVHYFKDF